MGRMGFNQGKLRMLAVLGLSLCATVALAQDEGSEPDCNEAMAQVELSICADREYKAADGALNAAYKQAMATAHQIDEAALDMGPDYVGAVEALKHAQRAWIGYRDGQCELAGFKARGGTMESLLVLDCLADLTRKRTAELHAFVEDDG